MFDFDTFIHMDRIILVREAEIKTLDLVFTIQAARNFIIHYVVDYSLQMAASMLCLYCSNIKIIPVSEQFKSVF